MVSSKGRSGLTGTWRCDGLLREFDNLLLFLQSFLMLRTVINVVFILGLVASVEVMVMESAEKRLTVGDGD